MKKPSKKKQGEVSTSGTSTAKSVGKETPSAATGGRSMKGTTSSSAPSKEKSTADKKVHLLITFH